MFSEIFMLWDVPLENWMHTRFLTVVVSVIEVIPSQFRSRLCRRLPQILPLLIAISPFASPSRTRALVIIPILRWRLTLQVGASPSSSGVASIDSCSQGSGLRDLVVVM